MPGERGERRQRGSADGLGFCPTTWMEGLGVRVGGAEKPLCLQQELAVRQHLGTDLTVHRVASPLKVTAHGVLWRAQKEHRAVSRVEK